MGGGGESIESERGAGVDRGVEREEDGETETEIYHARIKVGGGGDEGGRDKGGWREGVVGRERGGGRGGERVGDGDSRGVEREGGETVREGVERKLNS